MKIFLITLFMMSSIFAQVDNVSLELSSQHLSQAVQIKTITEDKTNEENQAAFVALKKFLKKTYPLVFSKLVFEEVENGMLFFWKGSEENRKPFLLAAHFDVVPVEKSTEKEWSYPAFSGQIAEGFIWGRGAMDDKGAAISILEAAETLLAQGFIPKQSLYMAFGLNEEGGSAINGASVMAELLQKRKVELDYVLDEGSGVTDGIVPDVAKKVAFIGLTEKGYLTIDLVVNSNPGHSSMPPAQTSIGILAEAITKLEKEQMPGHLKGITKTGLESLSSEMPFIKKMVISNLWLFSPVVLNQLTKNPTTAASIRTTTAVTMISGGTKENVLPAEARATVNFRISPFDKIQDVIDHVTKKINDPRVQIVVHPGANEATPVSSTDSHGYQIISKAIKKYFADTLVSPSIMMGGTDARHYTNISKDIYRFYPSVLNKEDLHRYHGINERLSQESLVNAIRFFRTMMGED
ncbi:MAG: M20 family peptidase [Bacteriovoracaceae bacterium]